MKKVTMVKKETKVGTRKIETTDCFPLSILDNIADEMFLPVPCMDGVKIKADGKAVKIKNKLIQEKEFKKINGYYRITVDNKLLTIHRLVALTFVKNDNPFIYNVVNHKDGNKLNNHFINLEWISQKENILHAQKKGLKNDFLKIYIRDVLNNKIHLFTNIREAEKFVKTRLINREWIENLPPFLLVKNRYEIRLNNEDWYYKEGLPFVSKRSKVYYVYYKDNNPFLINTNKRELMKELRKINEMFDSSNLSVIRPFVDMPTIFFYDIKYNKTLKFKEVLNILKPSSIIRIRSRLKYSNWALVENRIFASKTEMNKEEIDKIVRTSIRNSIEITNGSEKIRFNSIIKTAKYLKVDEKTITKHLKTNTPLGNWSIKQVTLV